MNTLRKLPPLITLRAFEAAGRLSSFSRAAQELFVTQSAISHHILRLEKELGVALFVRGTRAVSLTAPGSAYHARISAAFDLIAQGAAELARPSAQRPLKVALLASFATRWLAPRLPAFYTEHPDIALQLVPGIELADVGAGAVDVAIRYGQGRWPGLRAQKIMAERLSVVCAPKLLADGPPIRAPADLLRHPLLTSHAPRQFEWHAWTQTYGLDLAHARTISLHDYNIVIEAALAAQGLAMGRHCLIAPQLASGALVQALPKAVLQDPQIGWWLVLPRRAPSPQAAAFCAWLKQAGERACVTHEPN